MSKNCQLLMLASLLLHTLPLNAIPHEPSAKESMPGYHQPEAKRIDLSLTFPTLTARDGDAIDAISAAAKDALAAALHISKGDLKVSFAHTSTNGGTHHVHFVQLADGVEISNAVANANFSPDGAAYSVYSSLVPTASSASFGNFASSLGGEGEISVNAAVEKFAVSKGFPAPTELTVRQQGATYVVSGANFTAQDIHAFKKLYRRGGGMIPCWDLSIDLGYTWQNVFVSLSSGEIIAVSDWSSDFRDATYLAVSPFDQSPYNSQLTQLSSPWDLSASPYGWHVVNGGERTDTYGNNVAAASNPSGSYSQTNAQLFALPKTSSSALTFNYQLNNALQAMDATNINAAVVNMFVASNIAHDFFYNYGFTENAANFQFNNFGRGGLDGDGVIATCQDMFYTDSQSRNNANFMTPAEGQSGRMRMYVFDLTSPTRDGAFDNGVVYHEWGHGLSSRLTGGGRNPNCLSGLLSGGMGEGWSDFWALLLTLPNTASRYSEIVIGQYLVGGQGIRRYPYSTNTRTNPYTYSWLIYLNEVHDIGEVWCTILYEVLWNIVDVSGWLKPSNLITGKYSGKGNADFASILIQGMKNQPCNPTFLQARDAILDADRMLFNNKYRCAIWTGFAKRGMGPNAPSTFSDDFSVPTTACVRSESTTTSYETIATSTASSATSSSQTTSTSRTKATPSPTGTTKSICVGVPSQNNPCGSCFTSFCGGSANCCSSFSECSANLMSLPACIAYIANQMKAK